jgi:predicted permease
VRQLAAEHLCVALLGGAAALLLSAWCTPALLAASPGAVPRTGEVAMDLSVGLFAVSLSLAAGLGLALVVGALLAPRNVAAALAPSRRIAGGGREASRTLAALVIGEVALAATLLASTGLLVRSVDRLLRVDPGFAPERLLTAGVALPEVRYGPAARSAAFYEELLGRVRSVPGVAAAGAIHMIPLAGQGSVRPFAVRGVASDPASPPLIAEYRIVTPGLFAALGIPLVAGRDFDERDLAGPPAVIVSEGLARTAFAPGRAIGGGITFGGSAELWGEVVGVVGDVRHFRLDAPAPPTMYWSAAQVDRARSVTLARAARGMTLVVRTASGATAAVSAAVPRNVRLADPAVPVPEVRSMEAILRDSVRPRSFTALLGVTLSSLSLLLALLGVYGVLSYVVGRSTQEFAVRLALGARPGEVAALAARRGARLVGAGLALGLVGGLGAARALGNLLFEVAPDDAATFLAVLALLAAVAGVACGLPAARASRVDPAVALRAE